MISKSVLILGGTGTISRPVLTEAAKNGYEVTIMNRGRRKTHIPSSVSVVNCDFYNFPEIVANFQGRRYDVIIDFLSRQKKDIERLYPFFANHCHQYIFISSSCVYTRGINDFPIIESSPKPNTEWNYNVEKYECEKKLIELAGLNNTIYTIIRPYITYDDERIPLGITPAYHYNRTIIERIKSGKPWFIWDEGRTITTLTHASDFARAVVGLFLNERAYNEDFHITSDFSCTQKELVDLIMLKLGKEPNYANFDTSEIISVLPEYKGLLLGDRSLNAIFDNSKIKAAIPDFSFSVNIEEGLDRVISYWSNKGNYDYDYIFDARIDRLISRQCKVGFTPYPNISKGQKKLYYIYRYLPIRLAAKLVRR
jgi:nucleoside-diphosphate-sugar epimerase